MIIEIQDFSVTGRSYSIGSTNTKIRILSANVKKRFSFSNLLMFVISWSVFPWQSLIA
jgi:hypothetical protein